MAKTKLLVSRLLVRAIFLSFLTILLTSVVCFLIMVCIPNAVYHKILEWMLLNNNNPEVYYTDYYRKLSLIANEEDWMLVTPLSYLFGGMIFGVVMAKKCEKAYMYKSSFATALTFTVIVLLLSYESSYFVQIQSAELGVDFRTNPYGVQQFVIGGVQTIYWIAVFLFGTFIGTSLKARKPPTAVQLQTPGITA